uniref:Galactose oxidase-like Early set domain-containing protein n=1 Tax=Araucaria cunninghamii TaxID=56994 RepID=A0A0D6QT77_ARACU
MGRSVVSRQLFVEVVLLCFVVIFLQAKGQQLLEGRWELLVQNAGVSAMHMTLLHTNKVLIFDQTEAGPSQIMRTDPPCNSNAPPSSEDCWAHSIEYDIATNTVRPLHVITDTFCSSGSFAANGTLVQTGGWNNGDRVTRYFTPCSDRACDWVESQALLSSRRWYASNQILPDDRIIVVGGRRSFNYEFVPKAPGEGAFQLPFLVKTNTPNEENNLYPFTHLSTDGNLFIFANRDSILLDYKKNQIAQTFPTMPGGGARNYPSSGSSIMLPLDSTNSFQRVEILICGGAAEGAFIKANSGTFMEALRSCGRMEITSQTPQWVMEDMPGPRVMGDMLILPTGEILIINGAKYGTAGWQTAREPALSPFLYRPAEALGNRFRFLAPTEIPRMYHSTANVLPDGRVLVGGSNSNYGYRFTGVAFPTELRMEAYIPYYLHSNYDPKRPTITSVSTRDIKYGSKFIVRFSLPRRQSANIRFHAYAPPFTTHTWSMNQRMLSLAATAVVKGSGGYLVGVTAPPSAVVAPSGYYLLTVVNGGIPSKAEWIRFVN